MKPILILFIILFAPLLYGQETENSIDSFFYNPNADSDLKFSQRGKSFSNSGIQYGVIFSPLFVSLNEGDSTLTTGLTNTRIWGLTYLWTGSYFYLRGKASTIGVIKAEGYYEGVKSDYLIDLDLAFLSTSGLNNRFKFELGRKYFSMGTGLILNGRGDGGELNLIVPFFDIKLLGMYTGLLAKDNNPYYLNDSDISDGSKRAFGGGEIILNILNHKFYVMALGQFDLADENADNPTRYFSQYYGGGFKGNMLTYLTYYAEFIYETGTSYVATTDEKATIGAYAANTGLSYFFQTRFNPVLIIQYAFGSGDPERDNYRSSIRSSSAGDDKGFIYFGTYNGGFALNPRLSNIHIFRGGFSLSPFSGFRELYLKRMSLISKYSYYMKADKESPINDGEASNPKSFIGQGIDLSLRWKIFSDLSFYINYGLFIPGDAFSSDEKNRNFIMTGMNLNF